MPDNQQSTIRLRLITLDRVRVALGTSTNFGWAGVRGTLAHVNNVQVIHDRELDDTLIAVVADGHPHVALVSLEQVAGGPDIVRVARNLVKSSPATSILAIGRTLDYDTLRMLTRAGLRGFLSWDTISPRTLVRALDILLETDLFVASPAAIHEMVAPEIYRRRPHLETYHFTDREQSVLQGLVNGLSEKELCEEEHVSRATMTRVIACLKNKLDARSLPDLSVRAYELGFGSTV